MHIIIKILLFSLFFVRFGLASFTQDQIITQLNDTIDCKILDISNNEISFQITTKGIISNGTIPQTEILTYMVSPETFQALSKQPEKLQANETESNPQIIKDSSTKLKQRFAFQIHSGYGYLTGSTKASQNNLVGYGYEPSLVNNYYKKFRNTFLSGLSLQYALINTEQYALNFGVSYLNQMNSSSISGIVDPGDGVHLQNATLSEHIYVNYYGITIRHIIYNKTQKLNFYLESGSGFTSYRNEYHFGYSALLFKSLTRGAYSKFGFETNLTKHIAFNIDAGYYLSMFNKFTLNNGISVQKMTMPKGSYEWLGKFTFLAGLAYKF